MRCATLRFFISAGIAIAMISLLHNAVASVWCLAPIRSSLCACFTGDARAGIADHERRGTPRRSAAGGVG